MLALRAARLGLWRQAPLARLGRWPAGGRFEATTAGTPVEARAFARSVCCMHWLMGAGVIGAIGTVKVAQQLDGKDPMKGELMKLHKSFALGSVILLFPRIGLRLITKTIAPVPLKSLLARFKSKASVLLLYGFMLSMSGTGMRMGWYSGKGIPFFDFYHLPGAPADQIDGEIAKQMVMIHKKIGTAMTLWTVFHMGVGVGGGVRAINPFV